jgi:hypothetical protein
MIKIFQKLLNLITNLLESLAIFLRKINNALNRRILEDLTLIRTSRNTLGRNITFVLNNNNLLEQKDLFKAIYLFLMNNQEFLDFGEHKVIIVSGKIKSETFNLHHNILIKNNTTFFDY